MQLCANLGIRKSFATPYFPQGDGIIERLFGTVKPLINILCEERNLEWKDAIPIVELALRSTVSKATGFTPAEVIFGKNTNNSFISVLSKVRLQDEKNMGEFMQTTINATKNIERIIQQHQPVVKQHKPEFKIGEFVWVQQKGECKSPPAGPFKVLRHLGDFAYELKHLVNGDVIRRNRRLMKRCPQEGDSTMERNEDTTMLQRRQEMQVLPSQARYPRRQREMTRRLL